jgi:hypothetical protein
MAILLGGLGAILKMTQPSIMHVNAHSVQVDRALTHTSCTQLLRCSATACHLKQQRMVSAVLQLCWGHAASYKACHS